MRVVHHEYAGDNSNREQDVHRWTGNGDEEPLPARMRDKFTWIPSTSIHRIFACHLDVAAERQRANPIISVAAPEPEKALSKSERKDVHANAAQLCHRVVAEFVH